MHKRTTITTIPKYEEITKSARGREMLRKMHVHLINPLTCKYCILDKNNIL